jgi:hypothetical protein
MKQTIHDVNHIMFCSKALREEERVTLLDRLIYRLYGKKSRMKRTSAYDGHPKKIHIKAFLLAPCRRGGSAARKNGI